MKLLFTRACALALAVAAVAASAHAQGARFTVEEMLKLQRVADPQLSPDGRWVVGGGGRTGRLAVWELRTEEKPPARKVADIQAPLREVHVVRFARGGSRIDWIGFDNCIRNTSLKRR